MQPTAGEDKRKKQKKRKISSSAKNKPEKSKKKAPIATQCDLSDDSESDIATGPVRKRRSIFSDSEVSH